MIPDTQVRPGVPIDHLYWIGWYISEKFNGKRNIKVIHLGDHWDMHSLSSYDKGKKSMEGARVRDDVDAGNEAFYILDEAIHSESNRGVWPVEKHFLFGNHEDRMQRAWEADAQMHGILGWDLYDTADWQRHDFLVPTIIDGVTYAHYFYNPMSGKPYGGMIETRLKNMGRSFTQGHQQGLLYGMRPVLNRIDQGLVAGSCYMHDEDYKGPQANIHWRGIVIKHEVRGGEYDPMFVSLDFLCRKYEGKPLANYKPKVIA